MRLPRKGILIRLCIYVPLLSYLSWRAFERWRTTDPAPAADTAGVDERLAPYKRTITLPDGTQQEIVELTPEQAEAILGPMPALDGADVPPAATDAAGAPATAPR